MKSSIQKIAMLALLCCTSVTAFSQIDIRVMQEGTYVSLDTLNLIIDANDNTGTGAGNKIIYFNIYNLSTTEAEAFYVEAEWLCSNSSAFYQFCQEYPPNYNSGTCHTFHRDGVRTYDGYDYLIPPDTCSYNYLKCHFFIYDYSVEEEHEKICRFSIKRRNTQEVLDVLYLVIRRGNLPCYIDQPDSSNTTNINTASVAAAADIYPNPARSSFTVTTKQNQFIGCSLYAADGNIIMNQHIENKKTFNLDVSDLSNGIYYVKLVDRKRKAFYKKVVVAH